MPPKPWPIVTDSLYGDVPNGLYPAADATRELVLLPFGGLLAKCTIPDCTEVRAGWSFGGYMYWLLRRGGVSVLFRVDDSGGFSEVGTIATSSAGPAWMRNNLTQLCIVDGVSAYVYVPLSNLFSQITDPDFPGAGALEYQDGYGLFFQPNTNLWFFSSINDFTTFDALDFYRKEARTDIIQGISSFNRELYIFGTQFGTEHWYNAGGDNSSAQNPTFARYPGGLVNYGMASPAGYSDMTGSAPTWLTTQGQLVQAQGITAKVVSTPMFHREVMGDGTPEHQGYPLISDAISFSYRDQGHEFHQVTFPTADVTWVLDGTTGLLLKRESYSISGGWGRHRANCYVLHNKKHYVGDFENGTIYEMSSNYSDDNGHLIRRTLYSQEIVGGRTLISFPNIQVLLEAGQEYSGGDPQIGLAFSRDHGKTWSNIVTRSAGMTGNYIRQANWNQMGADYNRMYRLTMTDSIPWKIIGLDLGI